MDYGRRHVANRWTADRSMTELRRRTMEALGFPVNLHRFRLAAGNLWSIADPANVRGVERSARSIKLRHNRETLHRSAITFSGTDACKSASALKALAHQSDSHLSGEATETIRGAKCRFKSRARTTYTERGSTTTEKPGNRSKSGARSHLYRTRIHYQREA